MTKRLLAAVLMASCSVTNMTPVRDGWDNRTDPRCDAEEYLAVGDALGAVIFAGLGGAVVVAGQGDGGTRAGGAVLSGVIALALAGSSYWGFGTVKECKEAKATYDDEQIAQANHTAGADRRLLGPVPVGRPVVVQRGFFCSSSPTIAAAGFCVRDKDACDAGRDVAIGTVSDLGPCILTETAWCYGKRCAPVLDACVEQRRRAIGTDGVAPECEEAR
jgi:hypothetical protein